MSRRYYLFQSGRLRRRENTLLLEKEIDGEIEKKYIPIHDVDTLYIFGEIEFNTRVFLLLNKYNVVVHFFNYYGFYSGSYLPRKQSVSGILLIEQVKHYLDINLRLALATAFVEGAAYNIVRNMRKYQVDEERTDTIEFIHIPRIFDCESPEELMAIEGNIRDLYYKSFDQIVQKPDFQIGKREKRPPTNPMNALISFGNSILYSLVLSEIYRTHLDPSISYLHTPQEKRFSLSLDIAEIFKPLIIDEVIFQLVNQNEMTLEDFEQKIDYAYLNEEGRKKFLKKFEEAISTTISHRRMKRKVSYRQLIRLECYKLIKHLVGDETYKPLIAWW